MTCTILYTVYEGLLLQHNKIIMVID